MGDNTKMYNKYGVKECKKPENKIDNEVEILYNTPIQQPKYMKTNALDLIWRY
jgi:hypothetical protein